jgi:uncharacterized protein
MGPKSFEQCAGFLKIPESAEPLDNTWVHPENYPVARAIRNVMTQSETSTATAGLGSNTVTTLKEKYSVGETTIRDIAEELKKPNRDPRESYPKPIMRKGVVTFEDLHEGMMITGKIKNVVDFGAFVDLGLKETALVHVSEMSDHFIKDPLAAVKVGDVMEFRIISLDAERRRIGLSRKKGAGSRESGVGSEVRKQRESPTRSDNKQKSPRSPVPSPHSPSRKDDDGTMYNPFADAFKKTGKK